jgi:HSP20 family protein
MEKDKDKKPEQEAGFEILGLGGLFKGLEKLVDLAGKLQETKGVTKEGEFNLDHIKKGMKGVYGFTIQSATGGGKPKVETFGNIRKTAEGPVVEEEREPITDLFDEEEEVVIIAEMPGIEEADLVIDLKDDMLDISAERNSRKYHKELLLPAKMDKEKMVVKYNNGILEIKIKK